LLFVNNPIFIHNDISTENWKQVAEGITYVKYNISRYSVFIDIDIDIDTVEQSFCILFSLRNCNISSKYVCRSNGIVNFYAITFKNKILFNKSSKFQFHTSASNLGTLKNKWLEQMDAEYERNEEWEENDGPEYSSMDAFNINENSSVEVTNKNDKVNTNIANINDNTTTLADIKVNAMEDKFLYQILREIITNPMYVKITQILNSKYINEEGSFSVGEDETGNILNNRDKQLHIEEILKTFWYKELSNMFKNKKSLFNNSIGINILINSISKLDNILNAIKRDKRMLNNKSYRNHIHLSENGIIISIVLTNVIPHIMKNKSSQNTATLFNNIGKELHNNLLINEWKKYKKCSVDSVNYEIILNNSKNSLNKIEEGLNEEEFLYKLNKLLGTISSDDYFKLGSDLVEIIGENSKIFIVTNVKGENNEVHRIIVPGQELSDEIIRLLAVDTEKLVMISEPSKWDISISNNNDYIIKKYGGLLLNNINKKEFVSVSHKNSGKIKLNNLNIINSINYLSSIPYTINSELLNYILFIIYNKKSFSDNDQSVIDELIKLNIHYNTKNIFKLISAKKYGELSEIHKHNSQYYSDKSIITSALLFSDWADSNKNNSLYFNNFIDWRGRLYTDTSYLSFQGSELAKSLIMFKNGNVLTLKRLEALKIYTANCYGLDKLSYNNRLNWVNDNLDIIKSVPSLDKRFLEKYLEEPSSVMKNNKTLIEFVNFILKAGRSRTFIIFKLLYWT
jgi:hypothetical protein